MMSHCSDCLLEGGGGFIGKKIVCDPLVFKLFLFEGAPHIVQHNIQMTLNTREYISSVIPYTKLLVFQKM